MNAVLDPRNDDAFKHSEAFKYLFHVYAKKVIKIKDLSTNGWKDPMIAEWKRILVDFPCLEALNSLPVGAKIVALMWAVSPDAVKIMCSMCLQLDMSMEERYQAGGYLHAEYPDDAEPVYVRVPDYLNEILVDSPELVPVSPECIDGDGHEYLSMLLKIDRKAGTMTFRMPKFSRNSKHCWKAWVPELARRQSLPEEKGESNIKFIVMSARVAEVEVTTLMSEPPWHWIIRVYMSLPVLRILLSLMMCLIAEEYWVLLLTSFWEFVQMQLMLWRL